MSEHADRALVEAIKRREARQFCRTCGTKLDADRYCSFCGRVNPVIDRPSPLYLSGRRGEGQKGQG